MPRHNHIDYLEMPARDLQGTCSFFRKAFGWDFVAYGPDYSSFSGKGINGGFFKSDKVMATENGSALAVFYSHRLEATLKDVERAGGQIVKPVFSFPGGRRFHFSDPSGNEYAVWSE